jgi:hypothetical protein
VNIIAVFLFDPLFGKIGKILSKIKHSNKAKISVLLCLSVSDQPTKPH